MPACAYVAADAIFVGRVSFTNDDRSGTFLQATLVRFDVEEIFKGISAGTKHVWVDPGSFTSCYEKYHLGERYLIVAQRRSHLPSNFAAMTLAPGKANDKAFPPGIDPARPPIIYWAPECSGSRSADRSPHIDMDYAMLRAYRAGQPLPRAFGRVYLDPFRGWPELNGPALPGARVTLTGNGRMLRTTTRADGTFALRDAPAGVYNVVAELPPFVPAQRRAVLIIPETGCGSVDFALRTTTELHGVVLDHDGRPAARIPVEVDVVSAGHEKFPAALSAETDAEGKFAVVGIPDAEVRLSYGSRHPSTTSVPFPLVYYSDSPFRSGARTLRFRDGEKRSGSGASAPECPGNRPGCGEGCAGGRSRRGRGVRWCASRRRLHRDRQDRSGWRRRIAVPTGASISIGCSCPRRSHSWKRCLSKPTGSLRLRQKIRSSRAHIESLKTCPGCPEAAGFSGIRTDPVTRGMRLIPQR